VQDLPERGGKMNATEMNKRLSESLDAQIQVYPCRNLRASNLGHPCERYLYLLIKHWDEQKPHDRGLQSIFNLGNKIEEFTIENIKRAGYEVITPTSRSWKIDRPFITGREDIRIKDENGELLPVEIKGISPFEFDKLNTIDDFLNSKKAYIKGYPAQLQTYMLYFGKEKGFFALTNKLTGETKFIEMPFDYDYAESLLQKAERIYRALDEETPPPACEDISFCENCSLQHICGECRRVPADIDIDEELDELIDRKAELSDAKKEYESIDRQIKERIGEREKVITGKYLIVRNSFVKKAFSVPESVQYRTTIKRL
jgi:CRISPR/Cas system-associated exonuclease Cas4 (RecB family)